MEISFKFTDKKVHLIRGSVSREIPKDVLVEILHIALSNLAGNRDYGNITSISKLFQTIDLECVPDDSDDSDDSDEVAPKVASAPPVVVKTDAAPVPVVAKTAAVTPKVAPKAAAVATKPAVTAQPKTAAKPQTKDSDDEGSGS